MPNDEETPDIMDTELVTEAQPDIPTASPDADAVKQYLAEKAAQEAETLQEETSEAVADSFLNEEPPAQEAPQPDTSFGEDRIELHADMQFSENAMDAMDKQSVTVNLQEIPITDNDERAYLKSMLNDTPFELDISLYGGNMLIHARSITVYEQQLAAAAAYSKTVESENSALAAILAPAFVQKIRVALQLRTCNGMLISDLSFKPEPNKFKEHIKQLQKAADELLGGTTAARWNAYIYALNIFEHKLTKLDEMALNRDFLNPGG